MKKVIVIATALLIGSIFFSACGGSKFNNTPIPDARCNVNN